MKYSVNHICGHTEIHVLFGPGKERERKLNWMESTDCSECYRAALAAKRDAENAKAAETNHANSLPTLTGSEKQIAWAETIRAEKMVDLAELETAVESQIKNGKVAADDPRISDFADFAAQLRAETRSSWWIETRHTYAKRMYAARVEAATQK